MYERSFHVGWGHLDSNGHMANTAYLDLAVDIRMMFFKEHGFPVAEFVRRGLGPVIKTDTIEYFRELRLLDTVRVTHEVAAMAENGSRFRLRNVFYREDGEMAARLLTEGGWLDLGERRLIAPPADLLEVFRKVPRADDFERLTPSVG